MVTDSAYWKHYLLRQSSLLKKCMVQKRWPTASFMKCELATMMGFYAVRKLIEATKLTDELIGVPISVGLYPSKGKPVTHFNNHRLHELYDLNAPQQKDLSLRDLCNQFVHSYVFMPVFDDESKKLSEVWITSDYQRTKALFAIEVNLVISIFDGVGNDDVRWMRATFDNFIGDFLIENRSSERS